MIAVAISDSAGARDMSVCNRWHSSSPLFQQTPVRGSWGQFLLSSFPNELIVLFAKIVIICDITKFFLKLFYIYLFIYSFLYIICLLLEDYSMNKT